VRIHKEKTVSMKSKPLRKSNGRCAPVATSGDVPGDAIEPHAQLRDQQGTLLAGIVRRDGEWVLGMGGKIAGSTAKAAQVFALIRRAALLHEAEGTPVRLTWSDGLMAAVEEEVAERGLSFEAFEEQLQRSIDGRAG